MPVPQKPSIGRTVHYLSYGTPGGEYHSVCRAAIITEIPEVLQQYGDEPVLQLCVLNPAGIFFNTCRHDIDLPDGGPSMTPGTWHWPERVD